MAIHQQYPEEAMVLLIDLCNYEPVNQFLTYCDKIAVIICLDFVEEFKLLMLSRQEEMNSTASMDPQYLR